MSHVIIWSCVGFAVGWWLKAIYYKRSLLIRTKREWYEDPRVQERYGTHGLSQAICDGLIKDDDANIPWWMP